MKKPVRIDDPDGLFIFVVRRPAIVVETRRGGPHSLLKSSDAEFRQ